MDESLVVRGVIVPLLTPLIDGGKKIDEDSLRALVEWLVGRGVHGVMPCGTTGEGPLLSIAERKRVVEVVTASVDGRVPVMAHVGTPVTDETIDLARHARTCGAAAVSVVTPYFYHLSENALIDHFCLVADAVADTPLFLYNFPQCAGNALSRHIVEAIIEQCSNVIGIKDSSGDLDSLSSFIGLREGTFQVICGSDGLLLQALQAGALASVSGNANVFPEVVVELLRAFWKGDHDGARRQQEQLDQVRESLHDGQSISLMKRILESRGLAGGPVRPPLPEATPEMIAVARDRLRLLGLL